MKIHCVEIAFQIVNSLKQKLHAVERTVKDKEAELT